MKILLLSAFCWFQTDSTEIKKLMEEQVLYWNAGDIDGFMKHYWNSDSLRFVSKNGITYGWKNTRARYKSGYPDRSSMGKLGFEYHYIEQTSDDCIIVIGKWSLDKENPASGYFSLIWRRMDGAWKISIDHTS